MVSRVTGLDVLLALLLTALRGLGGVAETFAAGGAGAGAVFVAADFKAVGAVLMRGLTGAETVELVRDVTLEGRLAAALAVVVVAPPSVVLLVVLSGFAARAATNGALVGVRVPATRLFSSPFTVLPFALAASVVVVALRAVAAVGRVAVFAVVVVAVPVLLARELSVLVRLVAGDVVDPDVDVLAVTPGRDVFDAFFASSIFDAPVEGVLATFLSISALGPVSDPLSVAKSYALASILQSYLHLTHYLCGVYVVMETCAFVESCLSAHMHSLGDVRKHRLDFYPGFSLTCTMTITLPGVSGKAHSSTDPPNLFYHYTRCTKKVMIIVRVMLLRLTQSGFISPAEVKHL